MVDYRALYDGYWGRPDRFGDSSFDDPAPITRQILAVCSPGPILDVGCGMGALVRELLKRGADAQGIDVSPLAVAHCNQLAPGRFTAGSILKLPFPDDSFETVVSTNCMEHLAPIDIPVALREMHRVCRKNVFLRIATSADRDGLWHLTVEQRAWWENAAFLAGFRKHPHYYAITSYADLEHEGNTITVPLQKISAAIRERHPLESLKQRRDLHMDMSRESGRRSDAHMARYDLAAQYVRDGDTVLDAACGMGYGSWMLANLTNAARVIGADLDSDAVAYAADNFSGTGPELSFRTADAEKLAFLPDNSVDVFVSFETLEHVPHPERLLAEARRVLRPGGRLVASVPNLWIDESGTDPNPHHLHVYDWGRLQRELTTELRLEASYAQVAGGGMKLTEGARSLTPFAPEEVPPTAAEWWLAIAMKDPVQAAAVAYRETALHWDGEPPNVAAFSRDYSNPWLVRALVTIGWRSTNRRQVGEMAREVVAVADPGSVDAGAALCILAYQLLESDSLTADAAGHIVAQIDAHLAVSGAGAQSQRWVVSLLFVKALLLQAIGERDAALTTFSACAATDPLVYSPLLATKTIEACRTVGIYRFHAGDQEGAREFWTRGLAEAQRALQADWREIRGDPARPFVFGLREAAQILHVAGACANNLNHLATHGIHRGLPDDWSSARRFQALEARARHAEAALHNAEAALAVDPAARLRRAVQDPRPLLRILRVTYVVAVMLMPPVVKAWLRPLAAVWRGRTGNSGEAPPTKNAT